MAKRTFQAGATSQTVDVFIQDSSSTIGAGLSGLAFNTSGLTAYYRKGATGTPTAITLATQTVGGAWSSGGFVELDATHMKGMYRFDVPDTVFAASPYAVIFLYGAANMAPSAQEVEILAYNPFDSVRLGLTALPNAAAAANGGLPTVDANGSVKVSSSLKKNASSRLTFTMTDSVNHNPVTGKTVAVQVSIDGAAFASCANTPATEISNGDYTVALAAADTNGNVLMYRMTATGCDDVNILALTQP